MVNGRDESVVVVVFFSVLRTTQSRRYAERRDPEKRREMNKIQRRQFIWFGEPRVENHQFALWLLRFDFTRTAFNQLLLGASLSSIRTIYQRKSISLSPQCE